MTSGNRFDVKGYFPNVQAPTDSCLYEKNDFWYTYFVPEESAGNLHLKMISSLATALLEDDFKETVKSSKDKTELMNYILKNMEEEN